MDSWTRTMLDSFSIPFFSFRPCSDCDSPRMLSSVEIQSPRNRLDSSPDHIHLNLIRALAHHLYRWEESCVKSIFVLQGGDFSAILITLFLKLENWVKRNHQHVFDVRFRSSYYERILHAFWLTRNIKNEEKDYIESQILSHLRERREANHSLRRLQEEKLQEGLHAIQV